MCFFLPKPSRSLEVLGVDKELHAKEYRCNTTKVKCWNSKSQKDNSLPQTCCPNGPRGSTPLEMCNEWNVVVLDRRL